MTIATLYLSKMLHELFQKDDVFYVEDSNYTYDTPDQYEGAARESNNCAYLHSIF